MTVEYLDEYISVIREDFHLPLDFLCVEFRQRGGVLVNCINL
jgi:hypothetical protein